MGEFASKGVAGSGLGLGIAGTALGLLNANGNGGGLLGGLFGGGNCQNAQAGMALNALAEKDAKIAELTAMRYSDNQDAAVYKQTLADNKTLRDEMYAYITPIAQESAANRERVAVLEAQQKIVDKACRAGIEVIFVDPRYTSQTCPHCNAIGTRQKHRFVCKNCGYRAHSDLNGGRNLQRLGCLLITQGLV